MQEKQVYHYSDDNKNHVTISVDENGIFVGLSICYHGNIEQEVRNVMGLTSIKLTVLKPKEKDPK